jgi:heptosyltransferase I
MTDSLPLDAGRPLRVLIVRIGAMGDVLHAMPAVAALRELHPDWFIGWAIEPGWRGLLQTGADFDRMSCGAGRSERMPLVDECYQLPAKAWAKRPFALSTLSDINATRCHLRGEQFDVCVDMQGALKSAVVGRMVGAKVFAGPAEPREAQARWLYKKRVSMRSIHVVEQGCELLGAAIGETLRPAKVTLPIDEEAEAWCDRLLAPIVSHEGKFVFIAPMAGWGAKQWPPERYGAVAKELGRAGIRTLVNAASPGDAVGMRVVEASGGAAVLIPCSVGQMIALVRRAVVVIAGDTGPLHLAAALERPVVGLFGPTNPARNGPYGADESRARVLRHGSSGTDHSRRTETEEGLMQITVEEVVEAALELLRGGPDKRQGKVDV